MNRSTIFCRSVAATLCGMALVVLAGWQLQAPELKSLLSQDLVPMVANSALSFLCAGIVLVLFTLRPSPSTLRAIQAFSTIITIIGLVTLIEYIASINLGIDQFIFSQPSDLSNHPGRMSIVSALNFSLVGLSCWIETLGWGKKIYIGQYAMLVSFFTTLYPFTGTLFGALHVESQNTTMAVPTAVGFLLITAAYFVRHAHEGWASLLFSQDIAGLLIRRILIPVAVIYPAVAFLTVRGEKAGLYNTEGGTVFMMVSSMALFTFIVLITAETISRLDTEKGQYKKFFELSSEVLMIAGTDGSIKLVSNAFTTVLGYSNQEGINNSFFYFIHPEDTALAVHHFELLSADQAPGSFQIQMKGKDGTTRHFLWSHTRDKKSGNVYAAGYDITKIKEAEQVRELAKRLTHQNEQLASFAHIASHNLRSHVGNLTSLQQLHKAADPAERDMLLGMIEKVTHHLSGTLNDLIESLRIKEDVSKERHEIYFEQVLMKTKEILSSLIQESKVTITHRFVVDSIAYPGVYLESIFLNLLSNAIKYRSGERPLHIHIETSLADGQVTLQVSDNGIGIDMNRHGDKLFGFYKTFHSNTDAKGLGLFITRTQIEAMGGTISAKSEVDKGTTFIVTLNRKPLN